MSIPQVEQVWEAWRDRLLADDLLRQILRGPRVYLQQHYTDEPEDVATVPWSRLLLQPLVLDQEPENDDLMDLRCLLVAEGNDIKAGNYDAGVVLRHALLRASVLLLGWAPGENGRLPGVQVVRATWLARYPQADVQVDDERNLLFLSAEYQTQVTAPG